MYKKLHSSIFVTTISTHRRLTAMQGYGGYYGSLLLRLRAISAGVQLTTSQAYALSAMSGHVMLRIWEAEFDYPAMFFLYPNGFYSYRGITFYV